MNFSIIPINQAKLSQENSDNLISVLPLKSTFLHLHSVGSLATERALSCFRRGHLVRLAARADWSPAAAATLSFTTMPAARAGGIKGSNEVSDGLTAVYRFEHSITTTDASQSGGRLAYAGLSGGFGTLTLGQVWSASYNHAGAITDKSFYLGNSTTSYRHGNALSYAHSTGPVSFQLDLISDGDMNTGQGIDKTEFGVTVGLGDIGSLALAHTTLRDTVTTMPSYWVRVAATAPATGAPAGPTEAKMITVHLTAAQNVATNVANGKVSTTDGIGLINRAGNRYFMTGASAADCKTLADNTDATDDCTTATAFVSQTTTETVPAGGGTPVVATTESYHFEGTAAGNVVVTPAGAVDEPGHKNTHLAVQFNVGGMTPYLGHSTKKNNQAIMGVTKTKTTHLLGSVAAWATPV